MRVTVVSADGRPAIRLQGRFDFSAHREFREATENALAAVGGREVSVDLGGVDYLDSSALGMLLMLRDKARAVDKTVSLVNCRGAVRQVLDIANFGKLFTIL
jgi:anti-anti-sigma factor